MAQITFSANLASSDIPLLSALFSKTVIIGKIDQDFELDVNNVNRLQKERRIPQVFYCHNVMPTGQGYQAIGYTEKIPASLVYNDFLDAFVLRDPTEHKVLFSPSGGKNYIWDRNVGVWISVSPIVGYETALVTVAYLEGETYIFYEKLGCFKYNRVTLTLDAVTLTSLIVANINGICSANGFLLAWDDDNTIYRSQGAAPTNFTPDPALGSGSGIPEDIKGKIVVVLPISNGYIVYTTANAVAASFQQNIRYPFLYKEVSGSAGIVSPDHVSWQDNLGYHYAWTIAGLQKVNKTTAVSEFPELTDFLVSKIFEDFNTTTYAFDITKLAAQVNVSVTVVGSRYVVISYGITRPIFTHAIIYDIAFKRFGKIKLSHTDCFSYFIPTLSGDITWNMLEGLSWNDLGDTTWADFATRVYTDETPKEILAFLTVTGQVQIVNFDLVQTGAQGVLACGKYQFVRERLLELNEIRVENFETDYSFSVRILPTLNGKTFLTPVTPFLEETSGLFRKYKSRTAGMNHSLAFVGMFHLVTLELVFSVLGKR